MELTLRKLDNISNIIGTSDSVWTFVFYATYYATVRH